MEIELYAMYWFQTHYKTVGKKSSVFSSLSVTFCFRTHTIQGWFYRAICQWLLLAFSGYPKVFFFQRCLHWHVSNWPYETKQRYTFFSFSYPGWGASSSGVCLIPRTTTLEGTDALDSSPVLEIVFRKARFIWKQLRVLKNPDQSVELQGFCEHL